MYWQRASSRDYCSARQTSHSGVCVCGGGYANKVFLAVCACASAHVQCVGGRKGQWWHGRAAKSIEQGLPLSKAKLTFRCVSSEITCDLHRKSDSVRRC
jgi:hypothetical protein